MTHDDRLDSLLERTAIVDVITGFANAFDAKDWEKLRSLLAAEIDVDYSDFRREPAKRISSDDYIASRMRDLAPLKTIHFIMNHQVEIQGDAAACISAYHICRTDPERPPGANRLDTFGHYKHTLARTARHWRITGIVQTLVAMEGNREIHGALRTGGS